MRFEFDTDGREHTIGESDLLKMTMLGKAGIDFSLRGEDTIS